MQKIIISKNLNLWSRLQKVPYKTLESYVKDSVKALLQNDPEYRTQIILEAIDATNKEQNIAEASSCKSGCSSCCHQPIMASQEEVDHLMTLVKEKNIEIDQDKLKEQATWDKKDYYDKNNRSKTGCVFLSDTDYSCQVYEKRPAACRAYFVVSHPTFCRIKHRHRHPQFSIAVNGEAEVMVSTLWSLSQGKIETLAKKVYEYLRPK